MDLGYSHVWFNILGGDRGTSLSLCSFGVPKSIVFDNGTCFTSSEFQMFLRQSGVKHLLSALYHPTTNGLAERAVQVVERGLKKVQKGSIRSRIGTVLFAYRLTPQTTTKTSPTELLFGHRLRSRLDLLKPNTATRVELEQSKQVEQQEKRSHERHFEVGDSV